MTITIEKRLFQWVTTSMKQPLVVPSIRIKCGDHIRLSETTKALPLFRPCGSDDRASVNQVYHRQFFRVSWELDKI